MWVKGHMIIQTLSCASAKRIFCHIVIRGATSPSEADAQSFTTIITRCQVSDKSCLAPTVSQSFWVISLSCISLDKAFCARVLTSLLPNTKKHRFSSSKHEDSRTKRDIFVSISVSPTKHRRVTINYTVYLEPVTL